ncbi:hypothetical protein WJX73_002641 [Symbiochloris irregularis]|uniref:F-box domain-containing protein n=1 Tax=Symbiochloris irregularis TaxID=706552 RepID=A0AAW1P2D9_9CHLO
MWSIAAQQPDTQQNRSVTADKPPFDAWTYCAFTGSVEAKLKEGIFSETLTMRLTELPDRILLHIFTQVIELSPSEKRCGVPKELFLLPQVCRSFRLLLLEDPRPLALVLHAINLPRLLSQPQDPGVTSWLDTNAPFINQLSDMSGYAKLEALPWAWPAGYSHP